MHHHWQDLNLRKKTQFEPPENPPFGLHDEDQTPMRLPLFSVDRGYQQNPRFVLPDSDIPQFLNPLRANQRFQPSVNLQFDPHEASRFQRPESSQFDVHPENPRFQRPEGPYFEPYDSQPENPRFQRPESPQFDPHEGPYFEPHDPQPENPRFQRPEIPQFDPHEGPQVDPHPESQSFELLDFERPESPQFDPDIQNARFVQLSLELSTMRQVISDLEARLQETNDRVDDHDNVIGEMSEILDELISRQPLDSL